jgi:hypothetical protein
MIPDYQTLSLCSKCLSVQYTTQQESVPLGQINKQTIDVPPRSGSYSRLESESTRQAD